MSESTTTSMRQYAVKYTMIIFLVIFLAAVLHYLIYSQYLLGLQKSEYQKTLVSTANSINRSVKFYQSVVDQLAKQHAVIDLLHFGSQTETQLWANEMQRILPDSIGLTLFDNDANALGIPGEMRLNANCLADMKKRAKSTPVSKIPVHFNIEEYAHFDLLSPVIVENEKIGSVFASFSLNTIRRILTDLEVENQRIEITTPEGALIASVGDINNDSDSVMVFEKAIKGTDWEIKFTVADRVKNVLVTSLLLSNITVFVFLSLIMYIAINRLFRVFVTDFEILSWLMQKIKEGTYDSAESKRVILKESRSIIRFIEHTAEELYRYQQKLKTDSTTDELTGLYNRRALNEELENCLTLANKGDSLHIVILDLDKFKIINDTYGHGVGDDVLKFLSGALKQVCNEKDICARAGGDEFIVVLFDYSMDDVNSWYVQLSELMNSNISEYNDEHNIQLEFGVSAGCTYIRNSDRKSTVLKRADNALYKIKASGGNSIECV